MLRPELTVVVLTYNHWDLARRCLDALVDDWPTDWELLLVDNGSTESFDELCHRPDLVRVIRLETNRSFSEACNAGGRAAGGHYLLFLNNDVLTSAEGLRPVLAAMRQDPLAGIAGAKLVYPGRTRVQHAGIRPMLWGLPSNYAVGADPHDPRINTSGPVFAVTAAVFCVERRLYETLRGFDAGFHFGYEDVDLCLRSAAAGRRVLYVPAATCVHAESETLGRAHYDVTRDENYTRYRARWDHLLVPLEREYLARLRHDGVRRVVVFGTGAAGRSLSHVLTAYDIKVVSFATSNPAADSCDGIAVRPLNELPRGQFDRLIVGTQFYFELEGLLRPHDPLGEPLFPVLD